MEDNPEDVEAVLRTLKQDGFDVSSDVVLTAEEFTSRIHASRYDIILADYDLAQWRGMEALDILRRDNLDVPLITVTGHLGEERAVDCIKQGAADYLSKDHLARLGTTVQRALDEKRLREQHRQSEKDLADQKFALDQHASVSMTDATGTITYVNDKFCSICGYSKGEVIGQNHRILNSGHHPKEFFHQMYQDIANGKVWRGEIKNRAKDGSIYWVETTIVPTLGPDDKPLQYIAIRADITKRKLAEEALAEQAVELSGRDRELARSNVELEQFAYVASHDLQEPLRMIANYTQLLAERYRGKLDGQADKYISYSVDGAMRMQALIHDLLKLSRVGKAELEPQAVDCATIVEAALKNLQAAIEESRGVVKCSGLPTVTADTSQLTQVFQNLIANAIKFHGPATPKVDIHSERKDREWVFTVSDNGIGIPQDSWEDIFVIFRRLHTRTEYAGNGIGLSICKKIIERHGGKLWIEFQATPGCCFKFTLPVNSRLKATQEQQA
jgi:two-component system, chemotaxis family, sensor kinase Cph1